MVAYVHFAASANPGVVGGIAVAGLLVVLAEGTYRGWDCVDKQLAEYKRAPTPHLEFLPDLDYRRKDIRDGTRLVESAYFCAAQIVNRGTAEARNVWTQLDFLSPDDGKRLLSEPLKGRWASGEQPDAAPQPVSTSGARFSRLDIPTNQEPEPLDLYVLFVDEGTPRSSVYAYDNENHLALGRNWRYRIDRLDNHFLVDVEVKADDGVALRALWEIQAFWPGPHGVQRWDITDGA